MVGLAKRRDERVFPHLMKALEQPAITYRVAETAGSFANRAEETEYWTLSG